MVELALRWIGALALAGGTALVAPEAIGPATNVAALLAAVGLFLFLLERRDLRSPKLDLPVALLDAAAVAYVLMLTGQLATLGALTALPGFLLSRKRPVPGASLAPLAAAMTASAALYAGLPLDMTVGSQALGALALGFFCEFKMPARTKTVSEPEPVPEPEDELEIPVVQKVKAPDELLTLRENYRLMEEHAQGLEERLRREHLVATLLGLPAEPTPTRFAQTLREHCGAEGLALFELDLEQEVLISRVALGSVPLVWEHALISVEGATSELRTRTTALAALESTDPRSYQGVVLLRHSGTTLGLVALSGARAEEVQAARIKLESVASGIAMAWHRAKDRSALARQATEYRARWRIAATLAGTETPRTLLCRVMEDVKDSFPLDHLAFWWLDEDEPLAVCHSGAQIRFFEATGWNGANVPEVFLADTHADPTVDTSLAVQRRVGSFLALPIRDSRGPVAGLTAATHARQGIARPLIESLRWVVSEVEAALDRLDRQPVGILTPDEFRIGLRSPGSLVVLEALRHEENNNRPALRMALREISFRLRAGAPTGAQLCPRDHDVLAFLPSTEIEDARHWANTCLAQADLAALPLHATKGPKVLSLRARVSELPSQRHSFDDAITSSHASPA